MPLSDPQDPLKRCLAYSHEDLDPYVLPLSSPFSFLFSFVNGKPFKININYITINILSHQICKYIYSDKLRRGSVREMKKIFLE